MAFAKLSNLFATSAAGTGPSAASTPLHPYFPIEATIVNYIPNSYDVPTLLSIFGASAALILGVAYLGLSTFAPSVRRSDKLIALWFILSACIHCFFEGYFVFNHTKMASADNVIGQLWKEYAFSDSRYLSSDPFVLSMEAITAVCWGPGCFVVAYLIAAQHPLRHPMQALVSTGQIYGDVLYYATSLFDLYYKNVSFCRPEAYYFWTYFVGMNVFWIVVPGYLVYQSCAASARAFRALDKMSKSLVSGKLRANGTKDANNYTKKWQ